MRQPKINKERALRAQRVLVSGGYWDHNEPCAVADILSDLRHLCDKFGWDFDQLNESGAGHYGAETRPDDIEQDVRRMHKRGDYPILSKLPAGFKPGDWARIQDAVSNSDMPGDDRLRILDSIPCEESGE